MSGGGMKGIAHAGALEVLQERGLLRHVREYVGTSAGALMAFCLCIGYSVAELRDLCVGFDFTLLQTLEPDSVLQIMETYGMDNRENLDRLLRILLKTKGYGPEATFADISGSLALRVYATDIHACEIRELSLRATPRMPLRLAVAASMAIPLYFTPVEDPETGHLLVDGGLIAHFPFHHLTDDERAETLGIAFQQDHKVKMDAELKSMGAYFMQLYYSVYFHQNNRLFSAWRHRILFMPCGEFPSMQFDSSAVDKGRLIAAGRRGAEEFLGGNFWRAAPRRRHSF
jgi:predicted acylesterase/phospholipase RssA